MTYHLHLTEKISIHALREEGDEETMTGTWTPESISIHALREEGDPKLPFFWVRLAKFLSTPSARRATALLFRPGNKG